MITRPRSLGERRAVAWNQLAARALAIRRSVLRSTVRAWPVGKRRDEPVHEAPHPGQVAGRGVARHRRLESGKCTGPDANPLSHRWGHAEPDRNTTSLVYTHCGCDGYGNADSSRFTYTRRHSLR